MGSPRRRINLADKPGRIRMAKNKWTTNIRDFAKVHQDSRRGFDLQDLTPQQSTSISSWEEHF
jgi:hypothetical protein